MAWFLLTALFIYTDAIGGLSPAGNGYRLTTSSGLKPLRDMRVLALAFYTPSDSYSDEMDFDRKVLEKARAAFQARRDTEAAQRPCPHGSLESKATLGCDSALPAVGKDAVGADHHC